MSLINETHYLDAEGELTIEGVERVLELSERLRSDVTLIEAITCTSCSGSGVYDHGGSPSCSACIGRGSTPKSEDIVRELSDKLSELENLDYQEARSVSSHIENYMKSNNLGWENEYYFI